MVEIMIACVLLTIIALAGHAFVFHGRVMLNQQQSRRVATALAVGRLEELLTTRYTNLASIVPLNGDLGYLTKSGNDWAYATTDPGETFTVNGRVSPVTTEVQFQDVNGNPYAMLRVAVRVAYHDNPADRVVLTTVYGP